MSGQHGKIEFEHIGIGCVLAQKRLFVPPNQRDYKWKDREVKALLADITDQIASHSESYFLGTLVLTRRTDGGVDVADGQQRLATSTILLSAIRDHFSQTNEEMQVERIENRYLTTIDPDSEQRVPRLRLNTANDAYFHSQIIQQTNVRGTPEESLRRQNERLAAAATEAAEHVRNVCLANPRHSKERLKEIVKFLDEKAMVFVLTVPADVDAFVMFETLNDRGLKTSQADLVKNFLFGEAKKGTLERASELWRMTISALECLDDDESDLLVNWGEVSNCTTTHRRVRIRKRSLSCRRSPPVVALECQATSADIVAERPARRTK